MEQAAALVTEVVPDSRMLVARAGVQALHPGRNLPARSPAHHLENECRAGAMVDNARWTLPQVQLAPGNEKNPAWCGGGSFAPCDDGTTGPYFGAAGTRTGTTCTSPLYSLGKEEDQTEAKTECKTTHPNGPGPLTEGPEARAGIAPPPRCSQNSNRKSHKTYSIRLLNASWKSVQVWHFSCSLLQW
jgi:hypothetical protein